MKEMNLARAEVSQRKREEKSGQKDLFDATSLQPTGHYDELREFFTKRARAEVWKLVFSRCEVLYDALWERAMRFPVVWDSDLKDWLAEWKEAGKIELPDLKPRERVPKLRVGHRIVRK